ncbi:uncharacterized protein V1510DRAFT_388427 [Dipodascopsis tothii]|uniref:uncharacterized protein n=1 Tax=Dipodascopsis tothii TaxID=44089 RepID=UPI0034CE075F
MAPIFGAKVKAALSGDTLLLTAAKPPAAGQPPAERILSLAYVSAPRIRREDGDEPYAVQSREFLRLLLVGQEVQFQVVYTVPGSGREYGVVVVPGKGALVDRLLQTGNVRVRPESAGQAAKLGEDANGEALLEKYKQIEAAAREAGAGLWGSFAQPSTTYDLPEGFAEQHKGATLNAVVERIVNGDRVVARIVLSPTEHVVVPVLVGGIRCPRSAPTAGAAAGAAGAAAAAGEPFGDLGKYFVELRLLQRSVKLEICGQSQQGVVVANVLHPAGNIAEKLLESGLATVSDWQSNLLGAKAMARLRACERVGAEHGANLWQGQAPRAAADGASFFATVSRVISADTLAVRTKADEERVIQLASVRGPRAADAKQASYVPAAREFVRKKAVGKHVKVDVVYVRPKSDNFDEREMATVELKGGANLAALLVENGLASVIRHRKGDEDRSPIWDELLEKEEAATKQRKGFHSGVEQPPERLVNASESVAKANAFLPALLRQKRIPAVVEFVSSGSRLRLVLPRENARIKFVLAGVSTPRAGGAGGETGEPFGDDARDFAARRLLQRDVEIDVTHVDRAGGFFGLLYVPGSKDTFAKLLLDEGLATVDEYSAQQSGVASQLAAAAEAAQAAGLGLWKDKGKAAAAPVAAAAPAAAPAKEYLNVAVTAVAADGTLSLQTVTDGLAKLAKLGADLTAYQAAHKGAPGVDRPRVNSLVAAVLPGSKQFARCRVAHFDGAKKTAEVVAVDFGTRATLPFASLRELPAAFDLATLPAQARAAKLSFVRFPDFQADYLADAVAYVEDVALSPAGGPQKQLVALVDSRAADALSVTLFDPSKSDAADDSINADLVAEGYVYVPSAKAAARGWEKPHGPALASLRAKEAAAKKEHRGIWEYGDIAPEDD